MTPSATATAEATPDDVATPQALPLASALAEKDLRDVFTKISVAEGDLVLTLTSSPSVRFVLHGFRDPKTREWSEGSRVSRAGETLRIPPGRAASLASHHSGYAFDPLPPPLHKRGFSLTQTVDGRSSGRELERSIVAILLTPRGPRFAPLPEDYDPEAPLSAELEVALSAAASP